MSTESRNYPASGIFIHKSVGFLPYFIVNKKTCLSKRRFLKTLKLQKKKTVYNKSYKPFTEVVLWLVC